MTETEIIDSYCQAWSDPDPIRRASLLFAVWSTDGTYSDPTVFELNAEALLVHIERMQSNRPGAKVLRSTAVEKHHTFARFGFKVVGVDGTILREGIDIITFSSRSSLIERVVGFFGSLNARDDA